MSRHNSNNDEETLSFRTTHKDGKFVREKLVSEPNRYFTTVKCLRKPAEVTDKLRRAHGRLLAYNRDSMKGGVGRLLKEDEVREIVVRFFENTGTGGGGNEDDNEDEDDIVSRPTVFLYKFYFISTY